MRARMIVNGWRVNGAIYKRMRFDGTPTWVASFIANPCMFLHSASERVLVTEQVGTRYRAGVGVIVNVSEVIDGAIVADVVQSSKLVEWEGAE